MNETTAAVCHHDPGRTGPGHGCYVPFFLVLLAWILAEGFRLLGWRHRDLTGSGSAERCVLSG